MKHMTMSQMRTLPDTPLVNQSLMKKRTNWFILFLTNGLVL